MKLAISLATRNRPQLLRQMLERTLPNIANKDTILTVMADADDAPTIEAAEQALKDLTRIGSVRLDVRAREDTIAEKWNRILSEEADVYTYACDDCPQITPGFDQKILDAAALFSDGLGFVFSPLCNASFAHTYALTGKMARKLGYLFPPYFPYWFVDHWIDDVARMIGRIAVADFAIDATVIPATMEMREPEWWATWFDAAYLMRRKEAHDILMGDDLQESDLHKKMIASQHLLVEYRSRWINDSVRVQAANYQLRLSGNPADARYRRVKDKAIEMLPSILNEYGMAPVEKKNFASALVPITVPSIPRAFAA